MSAICNCRCGGHERCGREASNYCDGCLDSLCAGCYSMVGLGAREHVMDYCDDCRDRVVAWANREAVSFEVVHAKAHESAGSWALCSAAVPTELTGRRA